jgi:hypothetical protein
MSLLSTKGKLPMKLFVSIALVLSFCLVSFAQDQQPPKKKPLSMDMNDVKAVPKDDKPKEESTGKEPPKTVAASPTTPTQPLATPTAPVDPEATWPSWAKAQKQLLVAYFEAQKNGEAPTPFFYYGDSVVSYTAPGSTPVNMSGLYSYKIIGFEGNNDGAIWQISVDAPKGRSSTAGTWFAIIKIGASGDVYRIYTMTRNKPKSSITYE